MSQFDNNKVKECLKKLDFQGLFTQVLGWDYSTSDQTIYIDEEAIELKAVADKRGFTVYRCDWAKDNKMPDSTLRRKIDNELTKFKREHLIVFVYAGEQKWQWARRELNKPIAIRALSYNKNKQEELIQALGHLVITLDEEESITLTDAAIRTAKGFDVEKVTKRFYDEFTKKHQKFLSFIKGIEDIQNHSWYASVILNRLMFIYFLQKKNFLDNNQDYLRAGLKKVSKGNYYKDFLCPLFFEGFAKKSEQRSKEMNSLLGNIPYLNGGLFTKHEIEKEHKGIKISNEAFESLFDFFDKYQWHLDDRPLKKDNEINPDVLGYIFEKYINQKQMGAYYTKEDITGYISKNTILPWLFEFARKECKVAFEPNSYLWRRLKDDPDRYIYEAMRKGADKALPHNIEVGLKDVAKRTDWNKTTAADYALPTEIWRETIARRQRYEEIKNLIAKGEINKIEDFITYNLDIHKFAQDTIQYAEGSEVVRAFWHGLKKISVLDPACGSGAFLFAALNILDSLYKSCLDRMEDFMTDLDASDDKHKASKMEDFREVLKQIKKHSNRAYFIYKTIIVQNLYGVDIMEEATEICKLRLFLKLASQLKDPEKIEPLPDIDFNIKAGNSLIGYTAMKDIEKSVEGKLGFADDDLAKIKKDAEDLDKDFARFRDRQTESGGEITPQDKQELQNKLKKQEALLNKFLGKDYGIDLGQKKTKKKDYEQWKKSHKPFHWWLEFYGIIESGGFDVVIGNPPYVEYSKVKKDYIVKKYLTLKCRNIYTLFIERGSNLIKKESLVGMVVPISVLCTNRTKELQELFFTCPIIWVSSFDIFPARLFEGAAQRLSIIFFKKFSHEKTTTKLLTSKYIRWYQSERHSLISKIAYEEATDYMKIGWTPRIDNYLQKGLLQKLKGDAIEKYIGRFDSSEDIYVHRIVNNFVKAISFAPYFKRPSKEIGTSDDFKVVKIENKYKNILICILNSSLFYWYWRAHGDGFHCGFKDISYFPSDLSKFADSNSSKLDKLSVRLVKELKNNSQIKVRNQKETGKVELQTFFVRKSKPTIDEIDRVLAKHYGFTDEELDFIINYDIKYRMGTND